MFHLVVIACLASAPQSCAERVLPAVETADRAACEARKDEAAAWGSDRPDLVLGAARCLPTAALPALDLQEIAPGVLVHAGRAELAGPGNAGRIANLGVVLGDSVTVIDPGGSRAEAEALYAAIRARSSAPIARVIVTHAHPDHSFGAEPFAEAGARIIAAEGMAEELAARADHWRGPYSDSIGASAMLGSRFVPPDGSVAATDRIALGDVTLILERVPPAHTRSDLMVLHEPSGVLFTGDLVFRELTPVLDGSLNGWLDWLARMAADPPRGPVVPGHGPVAASWSAAVDPMTAYLTRLRSLTREAIGDGMSMHAALGWIVEAMAPEQSGWTDFAAITERNAATAFAELEWE